MSKTVNTETRLYPIVIHSENDAWGYSSSQFGGGGAPTLEDALSLAQELLNTAMAHYNESREDAPQPPSPDQVESDGGKVVWLPVKVSSAADSVS